MKTTELKLQLLEFLSTIQGLPKYDIFPILQPVEVESDKTFYFTRNSFGKTKDAGFGYRIEFERTINLDRFFFYIPETDLNDFTNTSINRYVRLNESLVKLEENKTFTVGIDKDFEVLEDAIDNALNYYPNADYKITILIDQGYVITETIFYQGLDFSHIIISSTGFIIGEEVDLFPGTDVSPVFYFKSCWLPEFRDFYLEKTTASAFVNITGIYINTSSSGNFSNVHMRGFQACAWIEQSSGLYIETTTLQPVKIDASVVRRGLRIQNSIIDVRSIDINTDFDSYGFYESEHNTGIQVNSNSSLSLRSLGALSDESKITGNFDSGINIATGGVAYVAGYKTFINTPLGIQVKIANGIFYNNIPDNSSYSIGSNIPYNVITPYGIAFKSSELVPFSFDLINYKLSYLRAPQGEERQLYVDDTGKLILR